MAATLPSSSSEALRLEAVHKAFGEFVALQSIDLVIRSGELVCFLGPSGCGKTTLLRIIAGLETQTSGRIFQNGRDISRAPPAARDYGIVFQSYALFPNLTIAQNVAYGLVNRRKARAEMDARVAELLTLVGLPDAGSKYPSPARWPRPPACCCSTSRCRRSMPRCASACAARSACCSAGWA
jgi:iron(III) transport system ATP-binding protein